MDLQLPTNMDTHFYLKKSGIFCSSIFYKSYLFLIMLLYVLMPTSSFAVYPPVPENLAGTTIRVKVVTDENQHAIAAYPNTNTISALINTYYFSQNVWTNLSLPTAQGTLVGLSMNASGKAILTFGVGGGGNYQTRYFDGVSWNTPVNNPIDTSFEALGGEAVINDFDVGITVWSNLSFLVKYSIFSSNNWSTAVQIPGAVGNEATVDFNNSGNGVAAWRNFSNEVMVSHYTAGVWSTPVVATAGAAVAGAQIDASGNSIVLVRTLSTRNLIASRYVGGVFSSATTINLPDPHPDAPGMGRPVLDMAPDGTAVATWAYSQTFYQLYQLFYAQFDGTSWSPTVTVQTTSGPGVQTVIGGPTVSVNSSGNGLLFWGNGFTTPVEFYTANLPVGGVLGSPLLVSTAPALSTTSGFISASLADNNFNALGWIASPIADVSRPFAIASLLADAPTGLNVRSCPDRFAPSQRDCLNTITWNESFDPTIASYDINKNNSFIVTIPATDPPIYIDSNPCGDTVTYTLIPIDVDGVPGFPASITFN